MSWEPILCGHRVWAFHRRDAATLATLMGWTLRQRSPPELAAEEVAVSRSGLQPLFVGMSASLAQTLRERLGEPPTTSSTRQLGEGKVWTALLRTLDRKGVAYRV